MDQDRLAVITLHYSDLQEALTQPADMSEKILPYSSFASLVGVALRGRDDSGEMNAQP